MLISRRIILKFSSAIACTLTAQNAQAKKVNANLAPKYIDAVETARRLKSGEISVLKNLEQTIINCEKLNPKLNAIVTKTYDEALDLAKSDMKNMLFGGLPFAVKDLNDYHNTPTMRGSRAYKNSPSFEQSLYLKKIDTMGILSIGKTQTPEFGLTASTEPLLSGPVHNPWNLDHNSGGSSGGSAAMVASGILKIAHANDGGGSIRIPAACCGLIGLKTSRGRLIRPNAKRDPRTDISVQGVLSRTMRDTAVFLSALEDEQSGLPSMGLVVDANRRRLKIAYCLDSFNGSKIDDEVKMTVYKTAKMLKKLGHSVELFTPKIDAQKIEDSFMLLWAAGAANAVGEWSKNTKTPPSPEFFEPWTLFLAQKFQNNKDNFPQALEILGGLQKDFKNIFLPKYDVFLSPVVATTAPKIGYLSPAIDPQIHYERVLQFAPFFTAIMNASGAPAISLPMGFSSKKMPIGVQIAAQIGDEKTLLELGFELEKQVNWAQFRPKIWAE
jgi:amidase